MAKIKVHELAKELGFQSKEVIAFLKTKGVEVKAAQSSVEEDVASMVRREMKKDVADAKDTSKSAKPSKSAPKEEKPETKNDKTEKSAESSAEKAPEETGVNKNAGEKADESSAGRAETVDKADAAEGKRESSADAASRNDQQAKKDTSRGGEARGASQKTGKEGSGKGAADSKGKDQNGQKSRGERDNSNSDRDKSGRSQDNPPKKKKKNIIFVSNQQNSKLQGNSRTQGQSVQKDNRHNSQNNRNDRNIERNERPDRAAGSVTKSRPDKRDRGERFDGPRPLIRPLTPPSPTPVIDRTKTAPVTSSARKPKPEEPAKEQQIALQEVEGSATAASKNTKDGKELKEKRQDRQIGAGNANDTNQSGGNRGKSDNSKKKGKDESPRSERTDKPERNQNSEGRGSKVKGQQGGRDSQQKDKEQTGRRQNQDRDRRQKKDIAYEDGPSKKDKNKPRAGAFQKPKDKPREEAEEQIKVIIIPDNITIKELAEKMKLQPSVIVKKLFLQGQMVTVNEEVTFETAEEIAIEYDIICEREVKVDVIEELLKEDEEDEKDMVKRPPVVCVMGHVDHGKTSLLDAIRKTNVTDKEAGGITQHIGAYTVKVNGEKITFLDTPGHEAFTAMRMRGANSTDIAILVVAADDGVMPQTIEAINHAKAAGIEIIVAVNKIDKPNANVDRVKQELTEHELVAVDWGGDTEFVPVSAKSGEGIETLLETILLTAEILELKANPSRRGRGLVVEAELDKGRGPVATVLVQKGTLRVGDFISAGAASGKVRAMIDDKGKRIKEAGPSVPVEILGLSDVPGAGEIFIAHDSDKSAKSYAETYMAQNKEKKIEETKAKMSLDELFNQIQAGNLKELNVIVKADVQGSVEAVKTSLMKLSNEEVVVKCIHGGVGAITESDVNLASASNAIIIGFNVRPDAQAKSTAETEGVDIRLYKVIYQAIEDVEAAMKGMLDPVFEEKIIGHAEVRQIFKASAIGNIAGSYVLDGVFQRDCSVRITRAGEQLFEGKLASLKRFKDDVKEVKSGFECGLVFEGFDQMQELDIVEAYIMVEVPR